MRVRRAAVLLHAAARCCLSAVLHEPLEMAGAVPGFQPFGSGSENRSWNQCLGEAKEVHTIEAR